MIRSSSDNRRFAVLLCSVAVALWLAVFVAPARAGVPGTDPTTSTTEEPTTTTTEAVTTTTARVTTTTAPRPSSTTTTAPRSTTSSSTTDPPTTTTTAAPEIVTDDTLPRRAASSDDGGLSTDTKLALVVGSLVAVGVAIAVLTFFYWRHTRPQQYMSALDALADVESKVPRGPDDVPTAQQAAIATGAAGAAAGGAAATTTAVRILEPDASGSPDDGAGPESATATAGTEPTAASAPSGDADDAVLLDEPTTITTVEDLQTDRPAGDDTSR